MTKSNALLDAEAIYDLARNPSMEGRRKLGELISQFFKEELTDKERHLAADVLLELMNAAKKDLCCVLASHLSYEAHVPSHLIHHLAEYDDMEIATPIIKRSTVLKDDYLMTLCEKRDAEFWRVLAQRENLSQLLSKTLVSYNDNETTTNVVSNSTATIDKETMSFIAKQSRYHKEWQEPLLKRPEVDQELAKEIYWYMSKAIRQSMIDRFQISPQTLDEQLSNVLETVMKMRTEPMAADANMEVLAKRLNDAHKITPQLLLKTLKNRNLAFFSALIAEHGQLSVEVVNQLINANRFVEIYAIFKALNMTQADFTRLFMLMRVSYLQERLIPPQLISKASQQFRTMTPEMANTILKELRTQ